MGGELAKRVFDAAAAYWRRSCIVADGMEPVVVGLPDGSLIVIFLRNQREAVELIDLLRFHNGVECACALIIELCG